MTSTPQHTKPSTDSKDKGRELSFLHDVSLTLSVEIGRTRMSIQDLLKLGSGSVLELQKLTGEPLDVYANGKLVARGEAVVVNDNFGIRITEVVDNAL